jgi:hypothetical protein
MFSADSADFLTTVLSLLPEPICTNDSRTPIPSTGRDYVASGETVAKSFGRPT